LYSSIQSIYIEIQKQNVLEETEDAEEPEPKKRTVAVSKLTERLGLTEAGIRMFQDNDPNKK
jgi:hypothetical protein